MQHFLCAALTQCLMIFMINNLLQSINFVLCCNRAWTSQGKAFKAINWMCVDHNRLTWIKIYVPTSQKVLKLFLMPQTATGILGTNSNCWISSKYRRFRIESFTNIRDLWRRKTASNPILKIISHLLHWTFARCRKKTETSSDYKSIHNSNWMEEIHKHIFLGFVQKVSKKNWGKIENN